MQIATFLGTYAYSPSVPGPNYAPLLLMLLVCLTVLWMRLLSGPGVEVQGVPRTYQQPWKYADLLLATVKSSIPLANSAPVPGLLRPGLIIRLRIEKGE